MARIWWEARRRWWRYRRLRRATAAVTVGALVYALASLHAAAGDAHAAYGPTRPIAVAVRALGVGHVVDDGDVDVVAWPGALLPAGALERPPVGRTVVHPVVAGEPLLAARLAPDGLRGVAALLAPGERAIAVPVDERSVAPQVDDHVDLLATVDPLDVPTGEPSSVVAASARVLAVDDTALTVAVGADEARAVAAALARGTITPVVVAER